MGVKYHHQIGRLGIFSRANWIMGASFQNYMDKSEIDKEQLVYIQVGTQEGNETDNEYLSGNMNQIYIDCSLEYAKILLHKGLPLNNIQLNVFADETHTEKAWAKHLPEALHFLSKGW